MDNQVIIVSNAVEATIGVDVLANAFNLSQVDYLGRRIAIDSFEFDADDTERLALLFENDPTYEPLDGTDVTKLQALVAFKCDPTWFMDFDNFEAFRENYNGQGLYWQYFFHTWKTFSVSPYANAIVFTTQTNEITGVTVSPASSNVVVGSSIQMTAKVAGEGMFPQNVTWSMSGSAELASGTTIDAGTGLLHVAADETVGTVITVTAHAADGQTGTAQITVTAAS